MIPRASVPVPVLGHRGWPANPSARGYTVAELLVTLGLMSVIVVASLQLIVETVELARRGDRRLDPIRVVAVMNSLRKDLHGSAALDGVGVDWQSGPLELVGWDGGRVSYVLEDDRVVREMRDGLGRQVGRRVVTAGVESWRWRPLSSWALEVRVTVARARSIGDSSGGYHSQTRRFSVRGWPDGRSW